ncbi:MAG: hypothetical protein ACEY3L_06285 [Wolbachia sp.]
MSSTGMTSPFYNARPILTQPNALLAIWIPVSATWITPNGLLAFFRPKSQCSYSKH